MNDKSPLLGEIMTGEELDQFRRESLERGLDSIRRIRRRRRAVRACMLALPLLAALGIFAVREARLNADRLAASQPAPVASDSQGVKIIDEQELFALFPNRPIALIGKPGHEQIYFLDAMAGNKGGGHEE